MPKTEKKKPGWAWPLNCPKAHYIIEGRSLCGRWGYFGSELQDDKHNSPDNCQDCRRRLLKIQGKDPDEMDEDFKLLTIQIEIGSGWQSKYIDLFLNREKTYIYDPSVKAKNSKQRCKILSLRRRKNRSGLMETHVRIQWEGRKAKKIVRADKLKDVPGKLVLKFAGVEVNDDQKIVGVHRVEEYEIGQYVRGEDEKVYEVISFTPGFGLVEVEIEKGGKREVADWYDI